MFCGMRMPGMALGINRAVEVAQFDRVCLVKVWIDGREFLEEASCLT